MSGITFRDVSKIYGKGTRAVNHLDLKIEEGEFMVVVGPSGCGKTSALRMVAGLEEISEGSVLIGDAEVNNLDPRYRDIAMVFQTYALYPHMSVFDNIAFPLRAQHVQRTEIKKRVEAAAALLNLEEHLQRKPRMLSGGQRQRVAMGRALVRQPQAFLMDEPLSNLDAKLRTQMRAEVISLQRELKTTTMYVTHDQVEAMTMGDRLAVMSNGVLQQCETPEEVYERPANLFVAEFIGSPAMNLWMARVERGVHGLEWSLGEQRIPIHDALARRLPTGLGGSDVALGIRPEHLRNVTTDVNLPRLRVRARHSELLGAERIVHCELDARPVLTSEVMAALEVHDSTDAVVRRTSSSEAVVRCTARFDSHVAPVNGENIEITVDSARIHVFDPLTGRRIA